MANSSSSKSPGRTPPFVLVALVLLVVILGYNYWTLSSSNKTLREENNKFTIQAKDSAEKRLNVEKNLESAREELRVLQGNLEQVKKSLQDREVELNNIRADQKKSDDERKQCKDLLAKCDADLQAANDNLEKVTAEKAKLEASKPMECGASDCMKHMKDIVGIVTKLVGTDAMTKSLTDAGQDANKLMEGLQRVEAPVIPAAPKAPAVPNAPAAPAQPKSEQVKDLQTGLQSNASQVASALHASSASKNVSFNETKPNAQNEALDQSQSLKKEA